MAFHHGVRVLEQPTSLTVPIYGTAGLQVVVGTAPVNLAVDPYACTNTPLLINSFAEASELLGYSDDFEKYNICESIDASFRVTSVYPLVAINVLDPTVHVKTLAAKNYTTSNGQIVTTDLGILADELIVKYNNTALQKDVDYAVTFDDKGYAVITILAVLGGMANGNAVTLSVSGKAIDPDAVTKADIIGGYNASTGTEKGLEVIRQVFPKLNLTPGLLVCPGWSSDPNIAAALAAKCEGINGVFSCECIVDLDSSAEGATKYTDVGDVKEASAMISPHMDVVWPCARIGDKVYHGSAIKAAYTAYQDAENDDIPNLSPSNVPLSISGICLEDGTEVVLDEQRANVVNSFGVSTFNNYNGWFLWGNRTAAYPSTTDPKDMWFCCRRFFSWWGNSFILTYHQRVDSPANYRLIEAIVDDENVKGNSLVAQGKCAGAVIEYREEENTILDVLDGKIKFHQMLAPYTPAEDIVNVLEFDPTLLQAALGGE